MFWLSFQSLVVIVLIYAVYYVFFVVKKPLLHYSPTPRNLFILQRCPSLTSHYWPSLFFGKYLQLGVLQFLGRISTCPPYKREIITLSDQGEASLDWLFPKKENEKCKIIVLLLHTLTADSGDFNMIDLSKKVVHKDATAVVYNRRGHGNILLKTARFHCFGDSEDLLEVVEYISKKHKEHKIAIVGFSAGSALAGRFLGDFGFSGSDLPVICGISISPSYDVYVGMQRVEGLFGNYLLTCMKNLWLLKNENLLKSKNQEAYNSCIQSTSITEFIKSSVKFSQYENFEHYMNFTNPVVQASHIKVPFMCVNAIDDPITINKNVEEIALPLLPKVVGCPFLVRPKFGSHVAFLDVWNRSWVNGLVMEFIWAVYEWEKNK